MATVDAATIAQQALKLGLLTRSQIQEAIQEGIQKNSPAEPLLRALERKGSLTPWQSQKLLKGDAEGYFLGGYKLLYLISAGSFGRVYRAEDPQTGNVVAVKVLRKRFSEDKHSVELFMREGKVGAQLDHNNIVRILSVNRDEVSRQYYMVMEFVEGGSLKEFLGARKKVEPAEALRLIEEAASGLAHAHGKGMTHRDIKPTNILIASSGSAKLVDFGLAGVKAQGQQLTDETKVERTVDYAGLEKATGAKSGDPRSDVFFLGCVLYEMLTGRPPMEPTKDAQARMARARYENITPMNREEVNAPQSVFNLVDNMMALDPQKRYQTANQLLEAIRLVRRDLERSVNGVMTGPKTVFLVEGNERLRDAIRDHFKGLGYRVLAAGDPERALERFQQNPFDALVVDAGTTGDNGLLAFRQIMSHAETRGLDMAGILILNEEHASWADNVEPRPKQAVMVRPVGLKQLHAKIVELVPVQV
jgi:CheY-like chemotaxis protein